MAVASVMAWLQEVYSPDFLFQPSSAIYDWGYLRATNGSGANYTADAGADVAVINSSRPAELGSAQTVASAANAGLATGVLLAVFLNSNYEKIKREWRSEYQLWTEALVIRVAFSIVCLLLAVVTAPVTLLLFICFTCYRQAVYMLLRVVHWGKFAGLLDGVDAVWALEEDTSRSVINVLGMLEVSDTPDEHTLLKTLRQTIVSGFFTSTKHCGKLLYLRRRSNLGYFYWERQTGLQIEKYVRWMPSGSRLEDDGGISEGTVSEVVSKLANSSLPIDHASSWEILLSRRPITKRSSDPVQSIEEGLSLASRRYPVLFRVHHAVGDGVALLQLLMKALAESPSAKLVNPAGQRDGNLPDICITTGLNAFVGDTDSAVTEHVGNIYQNVRNRSLNKPIAENTANVTLPPKISINIASQKDKILTDPHVNHTKDLLSCSKINVLESGNNTKQLSSPQPFEFQSDKNYSNNMKIPCYSTDKIGNVKNISAKSVSINKSDTNMIVYFRNSCQVNDDISNESNAIVPCKSKENINDVKIAESGKADVGCNEIGIDMSELEDVLFSEVGLTTEPYISLNSQTSKEYLEKEDFSAQGAVRCRSPLLSDDIYSSNRLARKHTPDCLTTENGTNTHTMTFEESNIQYSSDLESRPCSPIRRPASPTPYSLLQNTRTMMQSCPGLSTPRSVSPSILSPKLENRAGSPENIYFNSETRLASPCDFFPNTNEISIPTPCQLSAIDTRTSLDSAALFGDKKYMKSHVSCVVTDKSIPKIKHRSPFKRSVSPNKLKGINITNITKSDSMHVKSENVSVFCAPTKPPYSTTKRINCNTNNNDQFTAVEPNTSKTSCFPRNTFYTKKSERHSIVEFFKNVVHHMKKPSEFTEGNKSAQLNKFVELFSKTIGRSTYRYQTFSRMWQIFIALIYAPASLIHQVLMKASDKNPLHGPTLSGEKIVTWYSEYYTPSSCKEYSLLNTIKRIKSRVSCKARFTDVFLTAVSSSLEMYFQCSGKEIPSCINVVVPLRMEPMPGEFSHMTEEISTSKEDQKKYIPTITKDTINKNTENIGNKMDQLMDTELSFADFPKTVKELQPSNEFSVALMALPITPAIKRSSEELLKPYTTAERLQEVCVQSELLRNSLDYHVNYWLMRVVAALLPVRLLMPVLNSTQSTLVVSNIKGPSQDLHLGRYKLADLVFWIPNRGTTGVGISLMGYAGRLQLGLIADAALVPTRRDADAILHNVVSELRHMDAAMSA